MKKTMRILGMTVALVLGLLLLIPFLSARLLLAWLPQQEPLRLVSAHGSLASGQGLVSVGSGLLARTVPGSLHWRWRLTPWPQLELTHPWLEQPAQLRAGPQGWVVSGQTLRLPAAVLGRLHPLLQTVQPLGELSLRWPTQTLAATAGAAPVLEVDWRGARSALAGEAEMGHYQITVSRQKSGLQFALRTVSGDLTLSGQGQWQRGQLQLDGKAKAARADDTRFMDLLAALGPQRQGVTHWRIATTTTTQE